jgi:F420-0:gamma-glutamyl ligase
MEFIPLKTRTFLPPKDDLFSLFNTSLPQLQEKDILVITSKIIAIHQGRCVKITESAKNGPPEMKINLIKKEADAYDPNNPHALTIKDRTLIPYAGIDRSNGNGYYILWPNDPTNTAKNIWQYLTNKYSLKELGIIISDSCLLPFRLGVTGISIGFYGFHPLRPYSGKKDVFNKNINKAVNSDLIDSFTATAVALMGEGGEKTPFLIIRNTNIFEFTDKDTYEELFITEDRDLFSPLLKSYKKS